MVRQEEKQKIEIGGNVVEVEGIPQCPEINEYYDEESGECNITFEQCDISAENVSGGCTKCNRAHEKYIKKMVSCGCVKPSELVNVESPHGKKVSFWKNKMNTVFLHTDENLDAARDNWWFRYLKEIPVTLWNVMVEKHDYPCAFALREATGGKKPERVLMNYDLPMVMVYPNMYYVIAPCISRDPAEIKADYVKAEELVRQEAEAKRKQEEEKVARQAGTKSKEPDVKTERPVIPTKTKREQYRYRRPTERKVYTQPPAKLDTFREEPPKKTYHTTRGVKIRG